MSVSTPLLFVAVGRNPARLFGMDAQERACRLATNADLKCAPVPTPRRAAIIARMSYAWDPAWLNVMRRYPRTMLTLGGDGVMVHVPDSEDTAPIAQALATGVPIDGYEQLTAETAELSDLQLLKRGRPFVLRLEPAAPQLVERAAYDAADNVVTDVLTLYLWRRPAFYLTRWAARAGITPNLVTTVGAICCLFAFIFFWQGRYWAGVLAAVVFMVLDTIDGKLARCTGASSTWGNVFDHGIDLVHPPFWWWAWLHGLAAYGLPVEPVYATLVLWVILGGYLAQRFIEGGSMKRFAGLEIHVWQPLDSRFRLITARRNPNMAILVGSLLLRRPEIGLELVAWWTLVCLIFHAVRCAQMTERQARGERVISWLEQ